MNRDHTMQDGGLYRPEYEHDACGVGLVVNINGDKYHSVVEQGLCVLEHMAHRGAEGADNKTGDGAGILVQIPHEFILLNGIPVPEKGRYGVGMVFLPRNDEDKRGFMRLIIEAIEEQELTLMASRDVPVNSSILGADAAATEPCFRQIFITGCDDRQRLEELLYTVRKRIEFKLSSAPIRDKQSCYIASLSTRTIVYKGMLSSRQLRHYFTDLQSPYFSSAIALVHSRFSTNTFPTWSLAQPFRLLGHNGEINTIRGNRLWMGTRQAVLHPNLAGDTKEGIGPIIQPGMSDSASLDNALEFFLRGGMSLPHALAMLVPESFNEKNPLSKKLKSFFEYHSIFMAPWDGPAAIIFADGRYAGGMLDRNGLRPARYLITHDGLMVIASETGVIDIPDENIASKGRLEPGKILMVDTEQGQIFTDDEIKRQLAEEHPYDEWLHDNRIVLSRITSGRSVTHRVPDYARKLRAFGYDREEIEKIIVPMAKAAAGPVMSMGDDTPIAILSQKPQRFFNFFRQQFAQVTNPPMDSIREELVMSLTSYIGAVRKNILKPSPELCKVVMMSSPIISDRDLDILRHLEYKGFRTITLQMLFPAGGDGTALEESLDKLCQAAEHAVDEGYNYLILSDREVDEKHAAIPSLLAMSAVHHYLIARRKRSQIAVIVESGEVCETMHVALLMGYGASGVNPYMAFAILKEMTTEGTLPLDFEAAEKHYIKAIDKGMLKIMSKMGISTIRSYRGAALFEPLGVGEKLINKYLGGGISSIGGIGIGEVARQETAMHARGFAPEAENKPLENLGRYAYRRDGERHGWNPATVLSLQAAARSGDPEQFAEFSRHAEHADTPLFLRDMLEIRSDRDPIDIQEVEPAEAIMRRFVVEAMSFGAISREVHETIAAAMNRIGGQSNTGEGGEDPARNTPLEDGTSLRSAVKQVASGRFGVDVEYLVNADEIQIKVAQGAKPGEGGQLPGFKVDEMIARTRHSIPGITLISPPPHHDIYSIEDLAQLIFDLKNVNPRAIISVKLVAESGVGTIAAGVTKAKADKILISGCDGGTGASPADSMKYAGVPVEIGLAEMQQTLVRNRLRDRVRLQADGQLKCSRDVLICTLLGAEEYGFGTAALVALGCRMLRKCHTNTCPMGVATQDAELRKRFTGKPEHLINYFRLLAEDLRARMAQMGYRSLDELTGRCDLLHQRLMPEDSPAAKLDLRRLLFRPETDAEIRFRTPQENTLDKVLDKQLLPLADLCLEQGKNITRTHDIANTDRSVGAMLSGHITQRCGSAGLSNGALSLTFCGSAGQSFGAFLCPGVSFRLEGDANDYLGKGLCGGKITVVPPARARFAAEGNVIAGNTLLYGATGGEAYINGRVGERFCVRNSGATAVVEGVGDHGCEYMTGGRVVVLGKTGCNFAAGMSGGIAYVWNPRGNFDYYCNMEMIELTLLDNDEDRNELHELITAHVRHTDSAIGRRMLDAWELYAPQFIKVTPVEYRRYLEQNGKH